MADDKRASPAYRALSPGAVRVLAVIEAELGDRDCCRVSRAAFRRLGRISLPTLRFAMRQLTILGFITAEREPPRRGYVFRASQAWCTVDEERAARLHALVRLPKRTMARSTPLAVPGDASRA
jgi:hypothetical protein